MTYKGGIIISIILSRKWGLRGSNMSKITVNK